MYFMRSSDQFQHEFRVAQLVRVFSSGNIHGYPKYFDSSSAPVFPCGQPGAQSAASTTTPYTLSLKRHRSRSTLGIAQGKSTSSECLLKNSGNQSGAREQDDSSDRASIHEQASSHEIFNFS